MWNKVCSQLHNTRRWFVAMPKTTLVLVTALFGVICGNRLMDNRLLRSSSAKSYSEVDTSLNIPCANYLDSDRDLRARRCNDNFVDLQKASNDLQQSYDDDDEDSVRKMKAPKPYPEAIELDDVLEIEPLMPKKNLRAVKSLQTKSNTFPIANYKDFYEDLIEATAKEEMAKRNGKSLSSTLGSPPPRGCDCKIRNDLVDLGQQHFPRYLLNAVCHSEHARNDLGPKCWSGSACRPLEYKVKVLTFRTLMDTMQNDPTLAWLPDDLRQIWKFKTVTVTAGCFCS